MLLCVDIGNTNITLGLFEGERYVTEFRLASDRELPQSEYEILLKTLLKDYDINGCIISSVVAELDEKFRKAADNVFSLNSLFLTYETPCGVTIVADSPCEVGADRIANAAAAAKIFPNKAVIVVDFGTATTFDIVNSKGEFCGGIIIPGIKTQLKSLALSASLLPNIEASISPCAVGHNTEEAVLSGVIRGSAAAVDGLIEQCESELGEKALIIATGGYCGLIANYMKRPFDNVNRTLTLEGLRMIYEINQEGVVEDTKILGH